VIESKRMIQLAGILTEGTMKFGKLKIGDLFTMPDEADDDVKLKKVSNTHYVVTRGGGASGTKYKFGAHQEVILSESESARNFATSIGQKVENNKLAQRHKKIEKLALKVSEKNLASGNWTVETAQMWNKMAHEQPEQLAYLLTNKKMPKNISKKIKEK